MNTHSINIKKLDERLTRKDALILLDVRRKADYESSPGLIPGAMWRDPEKVDQWAGELPMGVPTVAYCVKGGSVSQSTVDRLRSVCVDAVFLEGGLKAWMEGGHAVETARSAGRPYALQGADIERLRKAGVSEADIAHSVKVAEKALEIAVRTGQDLDMEFVGRGALFHDLGKAKTHAIEHGKLGAELGRSMGLPGAVTAVMEKHIRGGLSAEEAEALGLPVKDYTLSRLEERIIIYADRLVDIITDGIVSLRDEREAEDRFGEILRTVPKYGKNEKTLERYIGYHSEIQDLLRKGPP